MVALVLVSSVPSADLLYADPQYHFLFESIRCGSAPIKRAAFYPGGSFVPFWINGFNIVRAQQRCDSIADQL